MKQEEEGEPDELSALRAQIREDYVTGPKAPKDAGRTSLLGRLRRSWRDTRPIGRMMLIGAVLIVGFAVVVGSSAVVASIFPKPTPTPIPTFSARPFPMSLSLPGGLVFPLPAPTNPNELVELVGCRVVSLPWTIQLEAQIRALNPNDEIRLSMSNYDNIPYKVQSVEQVPSSDTAKLPQDNSPCLLVILSRTETDTLWVLTAKPR